MATFADYLVKQKAKTTTPTAAVSSMSLSPTQLSPVKAATTPQMASTASKTSSIAVSSPTADAQAKINAIKSQLADLTAKQSAMEKYNVLDSEELEPDTLGGYKKKTPSYSMDSEDPNEVLSAVNSMFGIGGSGTSGNAVLDALTAVTSKISSLGEKKSSQPTAMEQYKEILGELGITEKMKAVDTTTKLMNDLEANLNSRVGGTLTTQGQLARELAVERRPLEKQLQTELAGLSSAEGVLQNMLGLAQQDKQAETSALESEISGLTSLIPTLSSLSQYQTPQEELASSIAKEQLMKTLGLGNYGSVSDTTKTLSPGQALVDAEGNILYQAPAEAKTYAPPTSYSEWQLAGGEAGTGKSYGNYVADKGSPSATSPSELQINALDSARDLLTLYDEIKDTNDNPVGGLLEIAPAYPGSRKADFVSQFNNLFGLLQLEDVKYLKGQGQVSNAERRLLAEAATKLNRSQSKSEFRKTLQEIVDKLSLVKSSSSSSGGGQVTQSDGTVWQENSDGSYTRIK
jgi:hypothetical protein